MTMILPNDALNNFVFPNNVEVWWSFLIALYPFITGLVAGAFVVSSLYHVLKIEEFKSISNFSLIAAFCFGLFAGIPLLFHLGQPQRAFEILVTPHLTSAMSVFGYVYLGYMLLLMIEIWLIYRPFFIQRANQAKGLPRMIWSMLTLGVTVYHPDSDKPDHKLLHMLAVIGVPWACLLHGYVGFVFGSVKAIPWWATALQPIIFLSSAIVSGIAMLMLMYSFIMWRKKIPYDFIMAKKLGAVLLGVFILDWLLEMLELVHVWYQNTYEWGVIKPLLLGPLNISYVWTQISFLSVIPILLLGYATFMKDCGKKMFYLVNLGCLLLVMQVLMMRYNVVIGGQLISKSGRGFTEYHWEIFGTEGVLTTLLIFAAPFVVYYIISRLIPVLGHQE